MGFMGFKRPNGNAGVRNHVVVMSSVSCVNGVVAAIGRAVPGIKTITHTEGCGRGLADVKSSTRTLIGLAMNPNVHSALVVGLGCEFINAAGVAGGAAASGKRIEKIVVQELGGSKKATAAGIEIARSMLAEAAAQKREEVGWENLTLGLECGGSDALSGITANPLIGVAADWMANQGGTVILSETTEMIGAEKILARRSATPEMGERIVSLVARQKKMTEDILGPLANLVISPGNIEGGLSSISEKSLGCVIKGGTSRINELVEYGDRPQSRGLVLMDTPGSDIFSLTGMAAGGATLMLFSTGRGTPAGFPIVPVVKLASNSDLFNKMNDDMDVNAGVLVEGVTLPQAGEQLVELVKRVAGGEETKAEANLQDVVAIHTTGPSF